MATKSRPRRGKQLLEHLLKTGRLKTRSWPAFEVPPKRIARTPKRAPGSVLADLLAGSGTPKKGAKESTGKGAIKKGGGLIGKAWKGGGRFLGPAVLAADVGYIAYVLLNRLKWGPEAAARVEAAGTFGPEDVLRDYQAKELLAKRQARLMQEDPEAYGFLTELLGGAGATPELPIGGFMVGGPASRNVGDEEIQALLELIG